MFPVRNTEYTWATCNRYPKVLGKEEYMSDSAEEQVASGASGSNVSTRIQGEESQSAVTQRRGSTLYSMPSPFPEGWYFVATRKAVEKAKLIQKTWMGENILIWCDSKGHIMRL